MLETDQQIEFIERTLIKLVHSQYNPERSSVWALFLTGISYAWWELLNWFLLFILSAVTIVTTSFTSVWCLKECTYSDDWRVIFLTLRRLKTSAEFWKSETRMFRWLNETSEICDVTHWQPISSRLTAGPRGANMLTADDNDCRV